MMDTVTQRRNSRDRRGDGETGPPRRIAGAGTGDRARRVYHRLSHCGKMGLPVAQSRVAVQGFGNVGSVSAGLFHAAGARVVAVQDHRATLYQHNGLDIPALQAWQQEHGTIAGFPVPIT